MPFTVQNSVTVSGSNCGQYAALARNCQPIADREKLARVESGN